MPCGGEIMTELKTIKDFIREPDKGFRCKVDGKWLPRIVDGVELRMEAIKWCKELLFKKEMLKNVKPHFSSVVVMCNADDNELVIQGKIDWIIMFFGLNEEDLK